MTTLQVQTGSRLHLGLLEIQPGHAHQYGGLGVMIDQPGFVVEWSDRPWSEESRESPWKSRIDRAVKAWEESSVGPQCKDGWIRVKEAPMAHSGFGSGTQLACAIATLLQLSQSIESWQSAKGELYRWESVKTVWQDHAMSSEHQSSSGASPPISHSSAVNRLIRATQRGQRSRIGLVGFLEGGWVFDDGMEASQDHRASQSASTAVGKPLDRRWDRWEAPEQWRVLIGLPKLNDGIYGERENRYFEICQRHPNRHRSRMLELALGPIRQSILDRSLVTGATAIHEYGMLSGELFSEVQYGCYRSAQIAEWIQAMQSVGLNACGQSSWGPAVFGIAANLEEAQQIQVKLQSRSVDFQWSISTLRNSSASWRVLEC